MHGFDGLSDEREIHVTVLGRTHRTAPAGVAVHRSTLVSERTTVVVDGMRVVSRPIALIQLAASRGEDAAHQALDGMLRDGASPRWIREVASAWRRRGLPGPSIVLDLLDQVDGRIPRSWFQRLAKRALAATGLTWTDEHTVRDPTSGRRLADLDLAAPELMIGVECQSWSWHATPTARAADARRKRRLRRLGWEIIELWYADVHRPDEVLGDILDAVARRRAAVA